MRSRCPSAESSAPMTLEGAPRSTIFPPSPNATERPHSGRDQTQFLSICQRALCSGPALPYRRIGYCAGNSRPISFVFPGHSGCPQLLALFPVSGSMSYTMLSSFGLPGITTGSTPLGTKNLIHNVFDTPLRGAKFTRVKIGHVSADECGPPAEVMFISQLAGVRSPSFCVRPTMSANLSAESPGRKGSIVETLPSLRTLRLAPFGLTHYFAAHVRPCRSGFECVVLRVR